LTRKRNCRFITYVSLCRHKRETRKETLTWDIVDPV
jgi:hypothetical protein